MKNTREHIIETAIALFQNEGYENTSVAAICKACGITKGTFYYHFPNKDEITFAFYEKLYKNLSDITSELLTIDNTKDQLWKLIEYFIDNTISLTPQLLKAFFLSDIRRGLQFFSPYQVYKFSNPSKKLHDIEIQLIKKGQKNKEIKSGDPEMMLHTYTSALTGIAIDWASNDGPFDEKDELRKIFDVIF